MGAAVQSWRTCDSIQPLVERHIDGVEQRTDLSHRVPLRQVIGRRLPQPRAIHVQVDSLLPAQHRDLLELLKRYRAAAAHPLWDFQNNNPDPCRRYCALYTSKCRQCVWRIAQKLALNTQHVRADLLCEVGFQELCGSVVEAVQVYHVRSLVERDTLALL